MKRAMILVCVAVIGAAGLSAVLIGRQARQAPQEPAPVKPAVKLDLLYEYKGKGTRPKFNGDSNRLVERIEAGKVSFSATGMPANGGPCQTYMIYESGRITFADGEIVDVSGMSLEGVIGYEPAIVKGSISSNQTSSGR